MTLLHIVAGLLALLSGAAALYAAKGAPMHRKAGMIFVFTMIPMALSGVAMAAIRNKEPASNIPGGILAAYLVFTALTTVKPLPTRLRGLNLVATLIVLSVGAICFKLGFDVLAGKWLDGMPAFPFFMFGILGVLSGVGDLRQMRTGALQGVSRLTRHLWRMCFALLIATASLFLGQAGIFPSALRTPALLALPVVAVLVTMLYWLWRIRFRRSLRGLATADQHKT